MLVCEMVSVGFTLIYRLLQKVIRIWGVTEDIQNPHQPANPQETNPPT